MCDQDTSMPDGPPYTKSQGQYLAFIYYYNKIHGQPPAERDLQVYFKVSPPAMAGEASRTFSGPPRISPGQVKQV